MDLIQEITLLQWVGIIFIIAARKIRREIRRRRFKRTNAFGVQGFKSFEAHENETFFEAIVYLFGSVVRLLGIFLLLLEWVANSL